MLLLCVFVPLCPRLEPYINPTGSRPLVVSVAFAAHCCCPKVLLAVLVLLLFDIRGACAVVSCKCIIAAPAVCAGRTPRYSDEPQSVRTQCLLG